MSTHRLSRLSPTSFLGALLRLPLRVIPKSAVVRVLSGINKGSRWVVGAGIHGCWLGHYEIEKQAAVRRLVKPGMKVFDIGAHAGFYTLAFARLVGNSGHVWAFEPLAENVLHLRRHVELNALVNVTVVQAAVSDRSGVAAFDRGTSKSEGFLAAGGSEIVPIDSLDEFCAGAGIDAPAVIKLDIEGGEGLALKGAASVIAQGRATMLLSLHGRAQEMDCVARLRAAGYALQYLDGSPAHDQPLRSDEVVAIPGAASCAG